MDIETGEASIIQKVVGTARAKIGSGMKPGMAQGELLITVIAIRSPVIFIGLD